MASFYKSHPRARCNLTTEQYMALKAGRARRYRASKPSVRIHASVSAMIRQAIASRKAGRRWEALVGYSIDTLMSHLESQFEAGMSWDNYGEWQIDHITPRSAFHFNSAEDGAFRECWSLSNLQPLWADENNKKGPHGGAYVRKSRVSQNSHIALASIPVQGATL